MSAQRAHGQVNNDRVPQFASPPIVGRDSEVAQIGRAIADAPHHLSTLIDITGPQGIGKSTLLTTAAELAMAAGMTVVRASGYRGEQDFPYGVIRQLPGLENLPTAPAHDRRPSPDSDHPMAHTSNWPTASPDTSNIAPLADHLGVSLADTLRAIRRHITTLTRGRNLALIIDGFDWVDDDSQRALAYICRRGVGVPMVTVTAARLTDLTRSMRLAAEHVEHLRVGAMSDESLALLLPDLAPTVRESIVSRAEGNPFFAIELSRHLESSDPGATPEVPQTVTDAVLTDLATVSGPADAFAQAVSVLGDGCNAFTAGRLAELSEPETLAALDELVAADLMVAVPPNEVRFRHSLVATAVYEAIAPGRRLGLHAHAARLIQHGSGDLVAAARHLIVTAPVGDADAIDLITSAAMLRRGSTPRVTAEMSRAAMALLPDSGPLTDRLPLLESLLADALIRTGDLEPAEAMLRQALLTLAPDNLVVKAWLTASHVRVQRWLGRNDTAVANLTSALTDLPAHHHFERGMLEGMLVVETTRIPDVALMRAYAESGLANATASGQPALTLSIVIAQAMAESVCGDVEVALALTRTADDMLAHLPTEHVELATDAVTLLASVENWLGRSEAALACAARGREMATTVDNYMAEFWFTTAATSALVSLGRLRDAADMAESAEAIARGTENPAVIAVALAQSCDVHVLQGDVASARTMLPECLAFIDLVRDSNLRLSAVTLLLPALVGMHRSEQAVVSVAAVTRSADLPEIPAPQRALIQEFLVIAELQRDELAGAQMWADRAVASIRSCDVAMSHSAALRASARARSAAGDQEGAVADGLAAVAAARMCTRPLDLAQSLRVAASSMVALGKTAESVTLLTEAAEIFAACGARGDVAHVRGLLRELGVRSQGRRRSSQSFGLGSLSERESEVAAMIAAGATNGDIAEQLFISVRTVEAHVSRILRKLQVDSRAGIAELVNRGRIGR